MQSKACWAALAALLFLSDAAQGGVPPTTSGTYILSDRVICQPKVLVANSSSGDQDVQTVGLFSSLNQRGIATFSSGTAKVDPSSSSLVFSGYLESGSVLLLNVNGTQQGSEDSEQRINATLSFTQNGNDIIVSGVTYHAVYGAIDKKGIAHTVKAVALQPAATGTPQNCVEQIELWRK